MIGEEHRAEAERLLALAAHDRRDATPSPAELTARAQVHATLYQADVQSRALSAASRRRRFAGLPIELDRPGGSV